MSVRALLVDDDDRLSELLASFLAPHGVSVERARDGNEGLARLGRETFDVLLLDLTMPGVDGLEVCRRVRAKSRA